MLDRCRGRFLRGLWFDGNRLNDGFVRIAGDAISRRIDPAIAPSVKDRRRLDDGSRRRLLRDRRRIISRQIIQWLLNLWLNRSRYFVRQVSLCLTPTMRTMVKQGNRDGKGISQK